MVLQSAMSITDEQISGMFNKTGLRLTRQRAAVYKALAMTDEHPTADQLFQEVAQQDQDISLATVYNTLEAFCKAGLALKLSDGNGSARFDATTENHLHFRDNQTGEVRDVPHQLSESLLDRLPREVLDQIEATMGCQIDRINIEFVGKPA